ncbi:hypothetical protein BaRGS_00004819 [Batillaria attramentaria]|uniref:Uncharacterized protein n=1 Tax=Batillaria attramentaria TaxID=370345 RepID=A0ABD0LYM5_9CAEN
MMAVTLARTLRCCLSKVLKFPAPNAFVIRSATGGHLPFWESGSGHYGKTLGQNSRAIVDGSIELIIPRLDKIPVPDRKGVFIIADYGTNDGYSSMTLMQKLIERLRKTHGEDLPIQVLYEDQEKNDFNSLFNRLQGGALYHCSVENDCQLRVLDSVFYSTAKLDGSSYVYLGQRGADTDNENNGDDLQQTNVVTR